MPDVCLQLRPGSRFKDYRQAFDRAERSGFDGVEVDLRAMGADHERINLLSVEHGLPVKSLIAPGPVSFYLFDSEGDRSVIEALDPELIVFKVPTASVMKWPLLRLFEEQVRHYRKEYGTDLVAVENSCCQVSGIRKPVLDVKQVRDFSYANDVQVNFDVSDCAAMGMDILLSCHMLIPKVKNVHFSDYGGQSIRGHLPPGRGLLPLGLLLGLLHEYRYDGLITLELDPTNHLLPEEEQIPLFSEIVGFIRSYF